MPLNHDYPTTHPDAPKHFELVFQCVDAETLEQAREQVRKVLGRTKMAARLSELIYISGTSVQQMVTGTHGRKWSVVDVPTGFRVYGPRGYLEHR